PWRRWIEWRHRNINQFLVDIAAAGRSVNPDFVAFPECVTCDTYDATANGLDGAYLRLAEGISFTFEVDATSDSDANRFSSEDDWISLISMFKYGRGASGSKPAWAFTYGLEADDAAGTMAECLIAGCNPFEIKIPTKTISADEAMRTRMYGFAQANAEQLFDARSLANVALYHSSACRDQVEPSKGEGNE